MSVEHVAGTDELRQRWDACAAPFDAYLSATTLQLARTLIDALRLEDAGSVLEVGCGSGAAARLVRERVPAAARVVASDLSPAMLARARARVPPTVELCEADACALPFEGHSFARLLANLSLMLVPDPDRALAEAFRVLLPGGLAAWSVWGRPEHSPMFTLAARAAETVGIAPGNERSNFHLSERGALRARVQRHGFERVLAWYQPVVHECHDAAAYVTGVLATPRWRESLEGKPAGLEERVRAELLRLAEEHLAAGAPIALEALVVVATRPA